MSRHKDYSPEQVLEKCREYMKTEKEITFINKAYEYAKKAHEGQFRKSGEAYITHPTQVAAILAELELDPSTVASGYLHDVVEDTEVTVEELSQEFSPVVAHIVNGVTKLGQYKFDSKREEQAENHRKMLLAMAEDMRVVLVKLADRLHNMRTLEHHSNPMKQRSIAQETLDIYAPLADRLGISAIKWELEDLSLRYTDPQQYYRIVQLMQSKREEREAYINQAIEEIRATLEELNIEGAITGRPKHIYSIFKKMKTQRKQFEEIYDLLAVRVITKSVKDCYAVLGAIHTKWKPIPGRFKDYIAMPKENMYQSLHTTALGPKATPIEVQIRTQEMHEIAEYGVAAHWAYKEGIAGTVDQQQLNWFQDILDYQSESLTAEDFVDSVKHDLLNDKVYVFTPDNDVYELPQGASTLDFAYHIHTEVGQQSTGAKVNGRIVPLNYKLKNGDIIEIITSKSSYGPSRDWLKHVTTSKARNRIKHFFKTQNKEENIHNGLNQIEQAIQAEGYKTKEILTRSNLDQTCERFNYSSEEELYAAIGFGEIRLTTIVNFMLRDVREEEENKQKEEQPTTPTTSQHQQERNEKMKIKHDGGVSVAGSSNLLTRLSGCCNPVPGDKIIGYVTRGRGISVHRYDCPNIKGAEPERLLEIEWDSEEQSKITYNAELQIAAYDHPGLFNEIIQTVSNLPETINISNMSATTNPTNNMATIRMTIGISNTGELDYVVDKIKSVPDIYTVDRVIS